MLAIDLAHKQANALIKGDGGAIGVTEDPSALSAHTSVHKLDSTHYQRGADRFCAFLKDLESQEESLFCKPLEEEQAQFLTTKCYH